MLAPSWVGELESRRPACTGRQRYWPSCPNEATHPENMDHTASLSARSARPPQSSSLRAPSHRARRRPWSSHESVRCRAGCLDRPTWVTIGIVEVVGRRLEQTDRPLALWRSEVRSHDAIDRRCQVTD